MRTETSMCSMPGTMKHKKRSEQERNNSSFIHKLNQLNVYNKRDLLKIAVILIACSALLYLAIQIVSCFMYYQIFGHLPIWLLSA